LGWGQAVVERLSVDLRPEFPTSTGFSPQNLWLIRQFYLEYGALEDLQQLVGEIPGGTTGGVGSGPGFQPTAIVE